MGWDRDRTNQRKMLVPISKKEIKNVPVKSVGVNPSDRGDLSPPFPDYNPIPALAQTNQKTASWHGSATPLRTHVGIGGEIDLSKIKITFQIKAHC